MKFSYLKYPWGSAWCGMMLFSGAKNILLDSAVPEAFAFLDSELARLGLEIRDLDIVANTHSHADHTGMNRLIADAAKAEIISFKDNLQDNSIIDAGDYALQVFHTPGHTSDCISFLELSEKVLFTGDAFEGRGSRYAGVALYDDPEALLRSIEKIRRLFLDGQVKTMYLGHAYHGTRGVLQTNEILPFLDLCRNTVISYDSFLNALPSGISIEEAAEQLRRRFAVDGQLISKKAAEITVKAHRN